MDIQGKTNNSATFNLDATHINSSTYIHTYMTEIKNLHIAVDLKEYKTLLKLKGSMTWHDYLCREI